LPLLEIADRILRQLEWGAFYIKRQLPGELILIDIPLQGIAAYRGKKLQVKEVGIFIKMFL
jgi:hypothetical protein